MLHLESRVRGTERREFGGIRSCPLLLYIVGMNMDTAPPQPRTAATTLLVRDTPGFEVLMVKRHAAARVGPNALVFPGGGLDESDRDPLWTSEVIGLEGDEADRALRICALRELYEETAILVARSRASGDWRIGPQAAAARGEVLAGELSFRDLVRRLDLVLDLSSLTPFARWITPQTVGRRFDATFFIVTAPDDQLAASDGFETVSAEWLAPSAILQSWSEQGCELMFPTRMNLQLLAASSACAEAVARARARTVRPVQPRLEQRADGAVLVIPEDAGYGLVEERISRA